MHKRRSKINLKGSCTPIIKRWGLPVKSQNCYLCQSKTVKCVRTIHYDKYNSSLLQGGD